MHIGSHVRLNLWHFFMSVNDFSLDFKQSKEENLLNVGPA